MSSCFFLARAKKYGSRMFFTNQRADLSWLGMTRCPCSCTFLVPWCRVTVMADFRPREENSNRRMRPLSVPAASFWYVTVLRWKEEPEQSRLAPSES